MISETKQNIEYYRTELSQPFINKHGLEFHFISNYDSDPNKYPDENHKNTGTYVITSTLNGKICTGSYTIDIFYGKCLLRLKFIDYNIQFNNYVVNGSQDRRTEEFEKVMEELSELEIKQII